MLFTTVLKDNKAFLRCYKKGRFCADSFVAAYFYPNGSPYNRLGITAGKKQGCAVTRFIKKRLIKEMNKPVPKNNRSGRAKRK